MKIEYGGIGRYVTAIDFGSSISIPNAVKTNKPIEDISIQTEPDFRFRSKNYTAYTGENF